ncbi:MAG: hypothetical protein K8H74_17195, partial [Notoacmeibacter sp.]|nr:hypothetical protein [Notoacmeibacter sp.]
MTERYVHDRNEGIVDQVFGESDRGGAETVPSAFASRNRPLDQKARDFRRLRTIDGVSITTFTREG